MLDKLKRVLSSLFRPNQFKGATILYNRKEMSKVRSFNRKTLKQHTDWLKYDDWKNSYFGYGVPDYLYPLLNSDIGKEITYTDVMAYCSASLSNINYLELGVSVGKNFIQLMKFFNTATLTGFDIENINPVIENNLSFYNSEKWPSKTDSLRKEPACFNQYRFNTNYVNYLSGDIWDEASWEKLRGNKFNLIFSDALHDPKALLWEYQMMKKYNLLAGDFIFFWDDLNNGLEQSFKEIADDLVEKGLVKKSNVFLFKINGWMGKK